MEQGSFLHHRICNAAFAVLTTDPGIFQQATLAADGAAEANLRVGVILLDPERMPDRVEPLASLLHPLLGCVIMDRQQPEWLANQIGKALDFACADGTSPWRGRKPRLVQCAPQAGRISVKSLVGLMRGLARHEEVEAVVPAPVTRNIHRLVPGRGPRRATVAASASAVAVVA